MNEYEAEKYINEFLELYEEFQAYCRRDDSIRWSQEAEDAIRDRYFDAQKHIVSALVNNGATM